MARTGNILKDVSKCLQYVLIRKNLVDSCDHGTNWSRMIRAQMMVITGDLVQHMELALRNSITKVKSAPRIRLYLVKNLS